MKQILSRVDSVVMNIHRELPDSTSYARMNETERNEERREGKTRIARNQLFGLQRVSHPGETWMLKTKKGMSVPQPRSRDKRIKKIERGINARFETRRGWVHRKESWKTHFANARRGVCLVITKWNEQHTLVYINEGNSAGQGVWIPGSG